LLVALDAVRGDRADQDSGRQSGKYGEGEGKTADTQPVKESIHLIV
jgi:hypothetical protein